MTAKELVLLWYVAATLLSLSSSKLVCGDDSREGPLTCQRFRRATTLVGPGGYVRSLSFLHGNSNVLVSSYAARDGDPVRIWWLGSERVFKQIEAHRPDPTSYMLVASGPDDETFAVMCAGREPAISLWDITGTVPKRMTGFTVYPRAVNFISRDELVTVGGSRNPKSDDEGEILIWSVSTGKPRTVRTLAHGLIALAASPDGSAIVTGDYAGEMTVWNLATGDAVQKWQAHSRVDSVAYSSDGTLIASASIDDSQIKIWQPPQRDPVYVLGDHSDGVSMVAFQPESALVASAGRDGAIWLWDARVGKDVDDFRVSGEGAVCIAFSRDGSKLAVGGSDGTIEVWEAAR